MSLARPLKNGMNRPYQMGLDQRASGASLPQPSLSGTLTSYGTTTVAYSSSISASSGTAPYTWSVSSGSLPAGLSLDSSTGVVSGTPTAGAVYNFTLMVTDANSQTATSAQTITTAVFPTLSGSLPSATISVSYSQGLTVSNGHSPIAWDISAGTLPAGTSINSSTGVISGTPTTYGDTSFTVRATDAHGNVATSAQTGVTVYGPEMAGSVTDGSWTISLNGGSAGTVTQDGTGIHFAGAQNIAAVSHTITGVDGAIIEVKYTCDVTTSGVRVIGYGATTAHSGVGTTHNAGGGGSFTERLTLSAAGSFSNQVRIQATGTSGTGNTFNVTAFSCKRVG